MPSLRLVWKQYRVELLSVVVAFVLLIGACLVVASRVEGTRPLDACVVEWFTDDDFGDRRVSEDCDVSLNAWLGTRGGEAGMLTGFMAVLPFAAGVLLGSIIISREIEHRSAQLGWSLSGSRRRWWAERVVPIGALLLLLLAGLAVAGEVLAAAVHPGISTRASFEEYGLRGLPILARGLAAFSLAVLVGAIVARQLPALLGSGALILGLGLLVAMAMPFGVQGEWVTDETRGQEETALPPLAVFSEVDLTWYSRGLLAADGSVLTMEQADALGLVDPESNEPYLHAYQQYADVVERVPGSRVTEVELRESLLLGGLAVLALGGSVAVVGRRRPY